MGGSDKDGHLTVSDEGGSATEEIYATISRKRRGPSISLDRMDIYGRQYKISKKKIMVMMTLSYMKIVLYWGSGNLMDRRCKRTKRMMGREERILERYQAAVLLVMKLWMN